MQAWLPVILVWFVSIFASTFAVLTCIYKHLAHGNNRWKNIQHKYLSPWILLALLTAAFMVGNVWLLSSSKESDVDRIVRHAWLFIGLFDGIFLVFCIITALVWSKYKGRMSKNRMVEDIKYETQSTRLKRIPAQENYESATTLYKTNEQTLNTTQQKVNSNSDLNFCPNDDILILRNLSKPNEEFCLDLSNPNTPVVQRKSLNYIEDRFKDNILMKKEIVNLNDHAYVVTCDIEC
ncbi:uncharacterized protein LOC114519098 [Dendronephthya gigantea]|uniref:uncharacterized protein LOC114519098 n=1 Tax=Dendronephthya gigantea TaxID=151771 RepID=UPI00106A7F18|nr:uncharacterized protein LOC114519098 [Dendronephthya gigantea]XP_028394961.1 uncharacterized protein LOC114519098 [Dendronephthya gigantea]